MWAGGGIVGWIPCIDAFLSGLHNEHRGVVCAGSGSEEGSVAEKVQLSST